MADYMVQLALSAETRTQLGAEGKRICAEYAFETLQCNLLKAFSDFAARQGRSILTKGIQERLSANMPASFLPNRSFESRNGTDRRTDKQFAV
jgi:hypothetical protein